MSYRLEGSILEVCDCNVLCPRWVGEMPDSGTQQPTQNTPCLTPKRRACHLWRAPRQCAMTKPSGARHLPLVPDAADVRSRLRQYRLDAIMPRSKW